MGRCNNEIRPVEWLDDPFWVREGRGGNEERRREGEEEEEAEEEAHFLLNGISS